MYHKIVNFIKSTLYFIKNRLGINAIIRETIHSKNSNELFNTI